MGLGTRNGYLMLPIFGPSNERDVLGFGADTAANPLTYLTAYDFDAGNPLTYFSPYTYYSGALLYNNLTDSGGGDDTLQRDGDGSVFGDPICVDVRAQGAGGGLSGGGRTGRSVTGNVAIGIFHGAEREISGPRQNGVGADPELRGRS